MLGTVPVHTDESETEGETTSSNLYGKIGPTLSIMLSNTDLAVALLSLASPGILAL